MWHIVWLFILIAGYATPAAAEVRSQDLDRRITVTEGSQLSTQVDLVSLYFSSERIRYEPFAGTGPKIQINVVVLSKDLMNHRDAMRDLVARQAMAFGRELDRRLEVAAPSIALHFDPRTDLIFQVKDGTSGNTVAQIANGEWTGSGAAASLNETTGQSTRLATREVSGPAQKSSTDRSCNNCPSLVRKHD